MTLSLTGKHVIVTGHYGNWEIAGYALGLLGFHTHAIARTLDNPFLDDFFRSFRERTGRPLGSARFVAGLERRLRRQLARQKPGPKSSKAGRAN